MCLQAQQATLGRIGMGGLGESASHAQAEAGLAGNGPLGAEGAERRGDAGGVAHADVVHKASEAEQVLQLLIQQLRNIQKLAPAAGQQAVQNEACLTISICFVDSCLMRCNITLYNVSASCCCKI